MRFRRHAVSVVVTDLARTTAQDDIAHAACGVSMHPARALDVAGRRQPSARVLRQQDDAHRFGDFMVSDGEGIMTPWPPNAGLIGHVDTSRDNRSDATCPRR
ncbi:MAG: hypothetical protein OXQ84_20655 [bacterium]|nr:hypothetical protein [bacterium]